jgi:hypothetical protein
MLLMFQASYLFLKHRDFISNRHEVEFAEKFYEGGNHSMKKYVCIRSLELDKFDEDLYPVENEELIIDAGSKWKIDEESVFLLVAGSDAYRLVDESGQWIEIYFDTLQEHFEDIT